MNASIHASTHAINAIITSTADIKIKTKEILVSVEEVRFERSLEKLTESLSLMPSGRAFQR